LLHLLLQLSLLVLVFVLLQRLLLVPPSGQAVQHCPGAALVSL